MNYLEEYKILHKNNPHYGASAGQFATEVRLVIDYLKPKTVLDFGCGKASLIKQIACNYPDVELYGYDPAIEGRDALPVEKADLVICIDVLEHIPEDVLPGVIEKIAAISDNVFFVLHHTLAYNVLPNGKNAHCTVKPPYWYYELLKKYFRTPYPLPGPKDKVAQSCVITFTPSLDFLKTYHEIITPPGDNKFTEEKAMCNAIETMLQFVNNAETENKKMVIWGAGQGGVKTHELLEHYGVKVHAFMDSSSEKIGTFTKRLPVFSPEVLNTNPLWNHSRCAVFIASIAQVEIARWLEAAGWHEKVDYFAVPQNILTHNFFPPLVRKKW